MYKGQVSLKGIRIRAVTALGPCTGLNETEWLDNLKLLVPNVTPAQRAQCKASRCSSWGLGCRPTGETASWERCK